ncbi:MAG: divalent-cation tolerance protein CutA [Gemmatimonadota bacterium]|nr:divalent-cation tolerance protein CutA [Gemmatimonadota bacterium]
MSAGVRVALTTGPDVETLRSICRALIEERLIACANVLEGMTSIYRWEGAIEEAPECLAILKTTSDRIEPLEARLRELHPYDVPELVVLDIANGSAAYLDWVRESTRIG